MRISSRISKNYENALFRGQGKKFHLDKNFVKAAFSALSILGSSRKLYARLHLFCSIGNLKRDYLFKQGTMTAERFPVLQIGPAFHSFSGPYTVTKGLPFSRPQPGCHLPNSPCPGIIKLFPARESLVSDIPAGQGKRLTFFYSLPSRQSLGQRIKYN